MLAGCGGEPFATLLDTPGLALQLQLDEAVAVFVGVAPGPVVYEGPEVITPALAILFQSLVQPDEVIPDETDAVVIQDLSILALELGLSLVTVQ